MTRSKKTFVKQEHQLGNAKSCVAAAVLSAVFVTVLAYEVRYDPLRLSCHSAEVNGSPKLSGRRLDALWLEAPGLSERSLTDDLSRQKKTVS